MKRLRGRVLLLVVTTLALVVPTVLAQSTARTTTDPATALLQEVRALRAELAQASAASLRAQLLVARVQLQEQRILYFDKRRTELALSVTTAENHTRRVAANVQNAEERLETLRAQPSSGPTAPDPQVRPMVEALLVESRREMDIAVATEQRVRQEQADVASALAAEQGRWDEFNKRLDELERSLRSR